MATIEAPFLVFWRALNAALLTSGTDPATAGEARRAWWLGEVGAGAVAEAAAAAAVLVVARGVQAEARL